MKIEKKITIPESKRSQKSPSYFIASEMQLGDSVLCESQPQANNLIFKMRSMGKGATQRKLENGVRVWYSHSVSPIEPRTSLSKKKVELKRLKKLLAEIES